MMKQTIGALAIASMLMTIVGTIQAQESARHETVIIHAAPNVDLAYFGWQAGHSARP